MRVSETPLLASFVAGVRCAFFGGGNKSVSLIVLKPTVPLCPEIYVMVFIYICFQVLLKFPDVVVQYNSAKC